MDYKALLAAGLIVLASTIVSFLLWQRPEPTSGSVTVASEYVATTTAANSVYGATITGSKLIRTGSGTLGSVVITGANTGVVNIYNATTSNVNQRTGKKATSTILIATLPASLAAGTYVFDTQFSDGLYVEVVSGSIPTSTITYRP